MKSASSSNNHEQINSDLLKQISPWLLIVEEIFAEGDLQLSDRPLQAVFKLLERGILDIYAGDESIIDVENLDHYVESPWFRIVFEVVESWYIERYGSAAVRNQSDNQIFGVQVIHGAQFLLAVPTNRVVVQETGELAWMYFEDGLGVGEDPTSWIVDGPDISNLDTETRAHVAEQAKRTAEILRAVEFRRVTFRAENDLEIQKLIQSTQKYLSQAARQIVSAKTSDVGPTWFDLQMVNETALKAVIRANTGRQPHTHDLADLLRRSQEYGVKFEQEQLSNWPSFSDVSTWRYGQGEPPGIGKLYRAYQTTLEVVNACMCQITPGMKAGFGFLIRYSPWRLENAIGNKRE